MTVRSTWHINPGQTRADTRLAPVGTMTPTGATTTRAGVIPGGTPLNLSMSGMVCTISIGRAVVQGTSTQGAYPVVVTAAETFTVANGHASLTRYDTVWLVAYDQLYDTSGQTLAAIVYQQGTAGAGVPPTAPATGTAYLRLWDIQVPIGASAGSPPNWVGAGLLTDRRVYTVAVGGISPDASTTGTYAGQVRYNAGVLEAYNGTAWIAINPTLTSAYTESSGSVSTSSTTYTSTGTVVSTTVLVPPSGRVYVTGQCQMYENTSNAVAYAIIEATGSTSGSIRPAADGKALALVDYNTGDNGVKPACCAFRVVGVPGETLTLTWKHRVTGGAAAFDYRNIVAVPLAG